jgi:hypothetical protein
MLTPQLDTKKELPLTQDVQLAHMVSVVLLHTELTYSLGPHVEQLAQTVLDKRLQACDEY